MGVTHHKRSSSNGTQEQLILEHTMASQWEHMFLRISAVSMASLCELPGAVLRDYD